MEKDSVEASKDKVDNFVLGSSSLFRKSILERLGFFPSSVVASGIDETPKKKELPKVYCQRIAKEKAIDLSLKFPLKNILTADTVTCCGRRILPKALNNKDVEFCLNLLSGRRSRVYTNVCLATAGSKFRQKTVLTVLKFKRLSREEINWYIQTGEGIGKAGGYSISGKAERFIISLHGSYSSVVGLPSYQTACLLESIKIYPKY